MSESDPQISSDLSSLKQAVSAAADELNTLLEQIRTKKSEFDSLVETTSSSVTEEAAKARSSISQLNDLRSETASAKAALESDRAAVADVVEKAKATQREIEDLKTEVATAKGATDSIQQSAVTDQAAITQSKSEVDTLRAGATAMNEKLTKDHVDIAARIADLQAQQVSMQNLLKDLIDTKSQAEGSANSVKAYLDEVEKTKDRLSNLNSSSGTQWDELTAKQTALQEKISEIEAANAAIVALRRKLLESVDGSKSVQDEVSELHAGFNSILSESAKQRDSAAALLEALTNKAKADEGAREKEWTSRFEKLYESLKAQILALLPSAGAAGLAWTYFDAKSRYAPTPIAGSPASSIPNLKVTWVQRIFGYNPLSWGTTIFFYTLFMAPLLALCFGTYDLVYQIEYNHMPLPDFRIIALRFLIAVPLATLSTFGFVAIRLYRKLYEQYNHKQRVMELYVSFKREIELSGDDDQKKKLLAIMLDSVAEKAWQVNKPDEAERGDESPLSIEKFTDFASKVKTIFS